MIQNSMRILNLGLLEMDTQSRDEDKERGSNEKIGNRKYTKEKLHKLSNFVLFCCSIRLHLQLCANDLGYHKAPALMGEETPIFSPVRGPVGMKLCLLSSLLKRESYLP